MTTLNPNGIRPASGYVTPKYADFARKALTYSHHKGGEIATELGKNSMFSLSHLPLHLKNWAVKNLAGIDYHEFPSVPIGWGRKFTLSEPPMLPMVLFLFSVVLPMRLLMAHNRQRPNEPTKEIHDVLRRDVTTMGFLLFLLKPLVLGMNKISESLRKIPLLQNARVVRYSEMEKYYAIKNPEMLKDLVLDPKTREGLMNAAHNLDDQGLLKLGIGDELKQGIEAFQSAVKSLVDVAKNDVNAVKDEAVKVAFEHLEGLDKIVESAIHSKASQKLTEQATHVVHNSKYSDFLVRYAKVSRVFPDVAGFLAVCILTGLGPVAFNDYLSRKKMEEFKRNKQQGTQAGTTAQRPQTKATFAAASFAGSQFRPGTATSPFAAFQQ